MVFFDVWTKLELLWLPTIPRHSERNRGRRQHDDFAGVRIIATATEAVGAKEAKKRLILIMIVIPI